MPDLHWSRFETDRSPTGHGLRAKFRNRTWIAYQDDARRWRVAPTDRPHQKRDFKTWPEARAWVAKHASANPAPQAVHSRRRNREVTVEKTVVELEQPVELVDGETGRIEWEGTLEEFLGDGLRATKLRMHPEDVLERFAAHGRVDFGGSAFAPLATLRAANPRRRNATVRRGRSTRRSIVLDPQTVVVLEHEDGDTWTGTIEDFWAAQDEDVWPTSDRQDVELDLLQRGSTAFDGGAGPLTTLRLARRSMAKNPVAFPRIPKNAKYQRIGHFDIAIVPVAESGRGGRQAYTAVSRKRAEALLVYDRRGEPIAFVDIPLDERGNYWVFKIDRGEIKKLSSSSGKTEAEALAPLGALANPGGKHVACGDLSPKDCRQLQHVYESARSRGASKKSAAQQAWGSLDNPAERKVEALSKDRYRASAEEKRRYGGSTVTEFYVFYADEEKDASTWEVITGYGKTPGERKSDAIRRFRAKREGAQRNPSRRRSGARGRKKNGAGLGAFLGSLVGGALGLGVASVPLAVIGSIGGGALGGHLGAPKDRRRRGALGGAAGAAVLGPIGAAAGGYIGGRDADRKKNTSRRRNPDASPTSPSARLADLQRQGFMKPKKAKKAAAKPEIVACDDCLDWHRKGKHTADPATRAATRRAQGKKTRNTARAPRR